MNRVRLIATVAAPALLVLASAAGNVPAATASPVPMTYHGTPGAAARLAHSAGISGLRAVHMALTARQRARATAFRSPAGPDPAAVGPKVRAPEVGASAVTRAQTAGDGHGVSIVHAFNGLSQLDDQDFSAPIRRLRRLTRVCV
jgi:hypothetical protein